MSFRHYSQGYAKGYKAGQLHFIDEISKAEIPTEYTAVSSTDASKADWMRKTDNTLAVIVGALAGLQRHNDKEVTR